MTEINEFMTENEFETFLAPLKNALAKSRSNMAPPANILSLDYIHHALSLLGYQVIESENITQFQLYLGNLGGEVTLDNENYNFHCPRGKHVYKVAFIELLSIIPLEMNCDFL